MSAYVNTQAVAPDTTVPKSQPAIRFTDLRSSGEPFAWILGGALALGCIMIVSFLAMVFWNGATTFVPKEIQVVTMSSGAMTAGEATRTELYRPQVLDFQKLTPTQQNIITENDGFASRTKPCATAHFTACCSWLR